MSLHGDYDSNNIFAQIIRGNTPCYKIYEDDNVLVLLDLFPQSYGHCLVISKKSTARNILEISKQDLTYVMLTVKRVCKIIDEQLKPDGIQISQFNGEAAGQTIFHLHVHIIPHFTDSKLSEHGGKIANAADLVKLQEQLGKSLS